MDKLTLSLEEIMYLEETLRTVQSIGLPVGFREGENLAQNILDKLEVMHE